MIGFNPFTGKLQKIGIRTISKPRAPGSSDLASPPAIWYDSDANLYHVLSSVISGVATWTVMSTGGGGGGSLILLSDQTASASTSVEFTSVIDATYDNYMIGFDGVYAGTDDSYLRLQFSTDDGSTWITSSTYRFNNVRRNLYSATVGTESSTGSTAIPLTTNTATVQISNSSTETATGWLFLQSPNGTNKTFVSGTTQTGIVSSSAEDVFGENTGTTAVNAIRILMDSGTIAGGNFKLYGVQ